MKKLFGKRKDKDKDKAAPGGTTPAAATPVAVPPADQQQLPPLRLAQLQEQGGAPSGRSAGGTGRSGGPPTGGSSGRALVYTDSGYLRGGLSPTGSGTYGRSLSRTTSGVSSGRRSARRPRELLDLSQPEPQVEGEDEDDEWEVWPEEELQQGAPAGPSGGQAGGGDAGGSGSGGDGAHARQLTYEEQAEQIEADMALAYQLAMQDQQAMLAAQQLAAPDQQPPAALLQRASSSQSAAWGAASSSLRPQQPPAYHRQSSAPAAGWQQHSGRLQSGPASLPQLGSGSFGPAYSTASEDVAVAAALAESQFAAQQAAAQAALAKAHEDQYQAAISAAMEESLVTINYDDLLRDIQLWIFDLQGAVGDVNKALEEAAADTSQIDQQMAAANPDDAEGMHRLLWLSEQYPLVQARLQELAGRVAPVNDTIKALTDLCDFIRNDQPPLADAESVRDAVIARLFQDLGRQGLDAHHPFAAYGEGGGGEEQARKKGGGLRRLLSIGSRKEKPAATRGGDLRDLVRQLIEEAKRIPPPPPMPVDYDPLLAQLRGWVEELRFVKDDVQAALEVAHHSKEEAAAQLAAADPADKAAHYRATWLSEQHPAAEARLRGVEERAVPPTQKAAAALEALIERLPVAKPTLEEAHAARDESLAAMLSSLAMEALLPPSPGPSDVRGAVGRLVREAGQLPPMPEYVDYSALLADIQQWIEDLEGAEGEMQAAQREAGQATAANGAQLGGLAKADDPVAWKQLTWLSEQLPQVEARLQEVGAKLAPSGDAVRALRDARDYILASKPLLAEAEGMRDMAIGDLMVALYKQGLDARPLTPHDEEAGGGTAASRDVTFTDFALQLIRQAQQLPEAPEFVDHRPLLAELRRWVAELQAAQGDVQAARQAADEASAANSQQLGATDEAADPEGWHRLTWLSTQYPLIASRLEEVDGKVDPATGPAIASLQQLCERIEGAEPPLEECQTERDAAIAALAAALAAQGVELPASCAPEDVRSGVQRLIEEARNLPGMPAWVDYRPLLADIAQWVEALQAAQGDVAAAQQAAGQQAADSAAQFAAADEAADPEGWHRLSWLSQQHPLLEERLGEVEGRVAPPAGAAVASLQELAQRIQSSKPPLEEAEAARDAAVAALLSGIALAELPEAPSGSNVRAGVQQLLTDAQHLPEMPAWVDYRPLLADIAQWVEALEGCQADVATAQQAAGQQAADSAAQFAAADEAADPEGWHRLSWLSQQHPLVEERLGEVEVRVASPAGAAVASLQVLAQHIQSTKPPLEETEAARDAAVASLLAGAALTDLPQPAAASNVRDAVQQLLADAQRLPEMPAWVDYRPLLADIAQWVEELEGCQADVAAAQQAAGQRTAENAKELAAADEAADPEAHYRLSWLSQQHPLVEARLSEVEGRVGPPAGTAVASLQELAQRIQSSKPPLEEAGAARDAAVAALLAGIELEGLPASPAASDVRGGVRRLVEDAQRLPEMPPMPVNYDDLLADIRQWLVALEGCQADVATAQQAAVQQAADSAAQFAAADEAADPEGWHRLSWLSQQHPLVEERLQGLGAKLEAMPAAAAALQGLVRLIEEEQPPLADATAQRDAATLALMEGLSGHGINVQSAPDARSTVQQLIADAQRLPEMPAWVDYRPLLADIAQWVEALQAAQGDVAAAQQAAGQRTAENGDELAASDIQADPEGWHRLNWLSQQLPQVEARLLEVAGRVEPTQEAVSALQALAQQVQSEKPPLAAAERSRNGAIATTLAALALKKLPAQASPGEVLEGVRQLIKKAQHLPPVPPMPVQLYVPPPAPEHHRSPIVAPKFNPPNLSAPRPRFKSRGVKPAPEDAIRRDPRAITLFNELAQGRGVVVTTIAWEATRRGEVRAGSATPRGGSAAATPRAGSTAVTPRAGSAAGTPRSAGAAGSRGGSASPAASAGGSAAATPRTPTPRPPSPSPEPSEPELSEEEAAAYLPTLPARALAVAAFEPRSLQEVSDFVSDVRAQGGDAPRSAHAACAFPARKWAVMAEAAAAFDALLDACDTLAKWECPPQASVVAESHRLADCLEAAQKVVSRVSYPHDPLRVRMAKAGLPWDDALLTDLRWAAQHAAAALMRHALDSADVLAKAKGKWQTSATVQPLGSAFCGAFKVHQFCGGFNLECGALFDTLHERTVHYARMMDPAWFRSSKVAG